MKMLPKKHGYSGGIVYAMTEFDIHTGDSKAYGNEDGEGYGDGTIFVPFNPFMLRLSNFNGCEIWNGNGRLYGYERGENYFRGDGWKRYPHSLIVKVS